jgi:hypothetical protein
MKNIYLIQTETYLAKLQLDRDYGTLTIFDEPCISNGQDFVGANLYITSNELYTIGWYLDNNNYVTKTISDQKSAWENKQGYRKILLTTDSRLIKDNVQVIDDEFLEWFCQNPSCEEVEIESNYKVKSSTIQKHKEGKAGYEYYDYKIIIPKEEVKTSEEWQNLFPEAIVLNPDGWDRKNYHYSWYEEKITFTEYNRRLSQSTCKNSIPKEYPK